jgi:tetratricopeptide (TPR) repeat protein
MDVLDAFRRTCRAFAVGLGVGLLAGIVQAQQLIPGYPDDVRSYDPREVAMLPPYCKYTQEFQGRVPGGNDADATERWKGVLGPTYIHTHHYCWGLMKTHRGAYLARSSFARQHYLSDAVTEFDYVIARAPEDFVLLPEILSRKGENLKSLGRGGVAVLAFERALQIKEDYWPPYAHMSDYYRDLGDRVKAREMIERGLSKVPDAPALKRRLSELQAAPPARPHKPPG